MQEYILKEEVQRILFKIITEPTGNDMKKHIKTIPEEKLEEYKDSFIRGNFNIHKI